MLLNIPYAHPVESQDMHPDLYNIETFQDSISKKKWKSKCVQKRFKAINSAHKNFNEQTIFNGLRELYKINPDLVDSMISIAKKKRIKFLCVKNEPGTVGSFQPGVLNPGQILNEIPKNISLTPQYFDYNTSSIVQKNTLFHEFFHALRIENKTNKQHYELIETSSDIIYACSAEVFDDGVENKRAFQRTVDSCVNCINTRVKLKKRRKRAYILKTQYAVNQTIDFCRERVNK